MKIKTSEAKGLQLDWGVAVVMGAKDIHSDYRGVWVDDADFAINGNLLGWIRHDADPSVCMGLIGLHKIDLVHRADQWRAEWDWSAAWGSTPAEAVARCVIAMRLGDEFEVPDELGVMR